MFYLGMQINPLSFNNYYKLPKTPSFTASNKLSIYYYNDTHGNSDQMSEVLFNAKDFKENSKDKDVLVLSGGDNCSGGDYKKNEFIFDLMQNIMGIDASTIGNHEIDAGFEGFLKAHEGKNFPFVATNVEFDDDNPMKDTVKKSVIKEKNGVKYGIVGTMPIDFASCTKEEAQKGIHVMDFDSTVKALQDEINNLKSQGVNRIILLSHVGYDTDKKLAQNLDGVDIIIGGHTHSVVEGAKENENLVKSKSDEPVIITQGGENGQYFGVLDIEFNSEGKIVSVNNNLTPTTNREKNPAIEYIKSQNLGKSPHVGTIKVSEEMPANRRIVPNGWIELMADSMKNELDCQIALINSANLRKIPKAGNLTQADVTESSPMKNKLLKTKLTQKQLTEAIKNASKATMTSPDGYPGLLQGSGFTYKIDDTGELLELKVEGKAVDINNPSEKITYSAVYDNFVAKADGETPELAPKFKSQEFDFDKDKTMSDYISKLPNKENLEIKPDGRLEIVQTSKEKQKDNNTRKI